MVKIQKPSKKLTFIAITLVALAAISVFYIKNNSNNEQPKNPAGIQDDINFTPPTAEDKQRVEDNKQRNVARDEALKDQTPQQPNTKRSVIPTITYAGQYGQAVEIGGYVNGVFEDGGTCKATFSQSTNSFIKSVTAIKNTNSVDCPVMSANTNEFSSKGTWTVSITYISATAEGTSESKQIEVK